jgi:hypothetical protein
VNDLPEPELRPEEPRRYPSTIGGAVYIVVGLTTVGGLAMIAFGPWRSGLATMGGALIAGACGRLVLADHNSGMLKVRRKSLDVFFMASLGAALIALSIAVPNQPG